MRVGYSAPDTTIWQGNVLDTPWPLESGSVQTCVTSPPYFGLRSYGVDGQLGLEPTPAEFVANLVTVFREVWRVLRPDGTAWCNLGDSYNAGRDGGWPGGKAQWKDERYQGRSGANVAGLKPKDLMGMPWRVAFALQEDGWYLRSAITWCKRSCMPESVTDRPTSATEMIFLLSKQPDYFYDADAVRQQNDPEQEAHNRRYAREYQATTFGAEHRQPGNVNSVGIHSRPGPGGANLRNFWLLGPEPTPFAHFATFPTEIPRRAILAGTSEHGACSVCGAAWERVTEARGEYAEALKKQTWSSGGLEKGNRKPAGYDRVSKQTETLGFRPTCDHADAPVRPCVVLDPFMGSGTTALVARQLGRHSVGLELNPEYIAIIERRMGKQTPSLFALTSEVS